MLSYFIIVLICIMKQALSYKSKQFFFVLIKIYIITAAFYFIYQKSTSNQQLNFPLFMDLLSKNGVFSLKNAFILCMLTILNWYFEILKWLNAVSHIKKHTFLEAMEQSLASLTTSLFTPNRIGEYGAKAMYFSKENRYQVLLLNLWNNVNQMLPTTFFGIIGLSFLIIHFDLNIGYTNLWWLAISIGLIFAGLLLARKSNKFQVKGFSLNKIYYYIKSVSIKSHLNIFLYSQIRYLLFSFQFYFLLTIFGVEISYFKAMMGIASMYFIASIIPSVVMFEMVIKGSVAVFLFSYLNVSEYIVLCAVGTMWIFNFALPSIIGSYYVLNFKLQKAQA